MRWPLTTPWYVLAGFVLALQRVDTAGAPTPGRSQRGGPLAGADNFTRARAEQLRGETDVVRYWRYGTPACMRHRGTDPGCGCTVTDGNVLGCDGRLCGVIDWGGLTASAS